MSYEALVDKVEGQIRLYHDELIKLNDDLADHPELSKKEFETSKKMVELLRSKGFSVEYPFAGMDTAYKGIYGENNHKYKIALMVEYDALPEIGHACGHCLSGSISLLAGIALSRLQDELNADIHLIGTPDEEFDGAKPKMIRKGVFDGYDMAMMIHMYNCNQLYARVQAVDTYTYYFTGKAAHASAAPWDGRNAFNGAQFMFHAVDMLRQHVTPDVRMHGIIRYPGEAPNIVPEKVSMEMYLRASQREYLNEVVRMVDDCAKGAAIATQTEWEKKATAEVFDDFRILPFGTEKLSEVFGELGIALNGRDDDLFGSTDAGNVSKVCPTFHPTLQVVDTAAALHTKAFADAMKTEEAHNVLKTGAQVIARQVVKMLFDEANIMKLKSEFDAFA